MNSILHENMKKFCKVRNCKLYSFEPINNEKTKYHLILSTGFGYPEFYVTNNTFEGIGENKSINLTHQWIKFQEEISSKNETILGL